MDDCTVMVTNIMSCEKWGVNEGPGLIRSSHFVYSMSDGLYTIQNRIHTSRIYEIFYSQFATAGLVSLVLDFTHLYREIFWLYSFDWLIVLRRDKKTFDFYDSGQHYGKRNQAVARMTIRR